MKGSKLVTCLIAAVGVVGTLAACGRKDYIPSQTTLPVDSIAVMTSTDKHLQDAYDWARKTALSYSHSGEDSVGAWYEAALPGREAFCMRDVSHQCIAAQMLGLSSHNLNMFRKFVSNVSDSKDWCSYWEINRQGRPAPADYANDDEFWYNLNANFDVMQACLNLYEWTGDNEYIRGADFVSFYDKTVNDYVKRWQLEPEHIMDRPQYMNTDSLQFDASNSFHTCRGLPSYVENIPGLSVGIDLLATLSAGHDAYSRLSSLGGRPIAQGHKAKATAGKYRAIIDSLWWDGSKNHYNTAKLHKGGFTRGEGVPYLLWFDAIKDQNRKRLAIEDITGKDWNVENLSHFPKLLYGLGYDKKAYKYLLELPSTSRAEYPEVSFGVVDGCIRGAMGFEPSFSEKKVATLSRIDNPDADSSISNISVFGGYMNLRHKGNSFSEITNNTSHRLSWTASFKGDFNSISINGRNYTIKKTRDFYGNIISSAEVMLNPGEKLSATAY